jgi:hypothetical protein
MAGPGRKPSAPLLWFLLLAARLASSATPEYQRASSPPGVANGSAIFFQNVTHSSAVIRWAVPSLGKWVQPISEYRIRYRPFAESEAARGLIFSSHPPGGERAAAARSVLYNGTSCNCEDFCWMEISSSEPCREKAADQWVKLGHGAGMYTRCHGACCGGGYCGSVFAVGGSHRQLQQVDHGATAPPSQLATAGSPPAPEPFAWGYMAALRATLAQRMEAGKTPPPPPPFVPPISTQVWARRPRGYGGNWTVIRGIVPAEQAHALRSLEPDTLYTVQVMAVNPTGEGGWSRSTYALHTHAVPDRPAPVTVVRRSASSLWLHRQPPLTRGTVDCQDPRQKNVSDGICTTWGVGSPLVRYTLIISRVETEEQTNPPRSEGCTDSTAVNFDDEANVDSGDCVKAVYGCGDPTALNFDPSLNVNVNVEGACIQRKLGCTNCAAMNFDTEATVDDGSCLVLIHGCTDKTAQNWNPQATTNDGSCIVKNVWLGSGGGAMGRRLQAQQRMSFADIQAAIGLCSAADLSGDEAASNQSCVTAGSIANGTTTSCNYTAGISMVAEACVAQSIATCQGLNMTATNARTVCESKWNSDGPGACIYSAANGTHNASCVAADIAVCSGAPPGWGSCMAAGACAYTPFRSAEPERCEADVVDFQVTLAAKSTSHPSYGIGGASGFVIDGVEAPSLNLTRGRTYVFEKSWTGTAMHPLYFTTVPAGAGPGQITDLVEFNSRDYGQGTGIITFTPGYGLPDVVYYQCALHPNMGGKIYLELDTVNYPPPRFYPECLELCWTNRPVVQTSPSSTNDRDVMRQGPNETGAIEPFWLGKPDWASFPDVCQWFSSVLWNCSNAASAGHTPSNDLTPSFYNLTGCEHQCMRSCSAAVREAAFATVQQCPFGCDNNASTGNLAIDVCGVCGGDGSSCTGCTNPIAKNYDPVATVDTRPSMCIFITGCTDTWANNYNPTATQDDSSCVYSEVSRCHALADPDVQCPNVGFSTSIRIGQTQTHSCIGWIDESRQVCNRWVSQTFRVIRSGGCPDHSYLQSRSCIPAKRHSYVFTIPKDPRIRSGQPTSLPSGQPVGIAINGVPIYYGNSTVTIDSGGGALVQEDVDRCRGQIDNASRYQYRGPPMCLLKSLAADAVPAEIWDDLMFCPCGANTSTCGTDAPDLLTNRSNWYGYMPVHRVYPSPLIGWALDGFPIYGPIDEHGVLTAPQKDGGELDECNGRMGADGRYRYHLTPHAPHTVACFRGTLGSFADGGIVNNETCAESGYTNTYRLVQFKVPSCIKQCMPGCIPGCLQDWAPYGNLPVSGMIANGWAPLPPVPRIYHIHGQDPRYTVRDLEPCSRYTIRLVDINGVGKSLPSDVATATTDCRPPQPRPPIILQVTPTSITLGWQHAVTDTGSPVYKYRVFASQREFTQASYIENSRESTNVWKRQLIGEDMVVWKPVFGANHRGDPKIAESSMFRRTPASLGKVRLTRAVNTSWDLWSDRWVELNIPSRPPNGSKTVWSSDIAQQFTLDYLEPAMIYKFRLVAVSAAGESYASFDSPVVQTLDAQVEELKIFGGMPCITKDSAMVAFHAVSDGTNVQYTWRMAGGGVMGECVTPECAAMRHRFASRGPHTTVLYASNTRGTKLQVAQVEVKRCGCTDPANVNFWFAAEYTLPRACQVYNYNEIDKQLTRGEVQQLSVPLIDASYGVQVILRVDVGEVDIFLSNSHAPDISMNSTYQRHRLGLTTFVLINLDYDFVFDDIASDVSTFANDNAVTRKKVYITVHGVSSFSRFDILATRQDFTRGPAGPAIRRNLDKKFNGNMVQSGHYDFWEMYVPNTARNEDATVDVSITVSVQYGCATIYVSKYEEYPSPLRAHGDTYGYDAAGGTSHICATRSGNTASRSMTVTINFARRDPRTLFISLFGSKVYSEGFPPPQNIYDISGRYEVIRNNDDAATTLVASNINGSTGSAFASAGAYQSLNSIIQSNYERTYGEEVNALNVNPGDRFLEPGVNSNAGFSSRVNYMGWQFFSIKATPMALAVLVRVNVTQGALTMYQRAGHKMEATLPSRGVHDNFIRDDDGDGFIEFTMPFNQIGETGSFYIGLYGDGGSIVQQSQSFADTNLFTIKAIEDTTPDCTTYSFGSCTYITTLALNVSTPKTLTKGVYATYEASLQSFLTGSDWDNSTNRTQFQAAAPNVNYYTWQAPRSLQFMVDHFGDRVLNVYFNVTYKSGSVSKARPVTCVLYGSTSDPFTSHQRTHDAYIEYTFDSQFVPGTEKTTKTPNFASLQLAFFSFDPKTAHFSVVCDQFLTVDVATSFVQFHSGLISTTGGNADQLSRLCPGQPTPQDAVCNGHGSCVDEGEDTNPLPDVQDWSTPAPICYCDSGWLGNDCAMERFPQLSYLRIVRPRSGEIADPSACAPCNHTAVSLAGQSCPECGRRGVQIEYEVRVPGRGCSVLAYVDGEPAAAHDLRKLETGSNVTRRLVVSDLPEGTDGPDKRITHNIQLLLITGKGQTSIGSASSLFYVGSDTGACPLDCSRHGVCHHGYCICFDGYTGTGCEFAGEPPQATAAAPFSAYAEHTRKRLEAEGAAREGEGELRQHMSEMLLEINNEELSAEVAMESAKLNKAAVRNRLEMQSFVRAMNAQKEAAARAQDSITTAIETTRAINLAYVDDIKKLINMQVKAVQHDTGNFHQRQAERKHKKALRAAQMGAQWSNQQEWTQFRQRRIALRNGPTVPLSELPTERCHTDRYGQRSCTPVEYQEQAAEQQRVVLDDTGKIAVERDNVTTMLRDVPR